MFKLIDEIGKGKERTCFLHPQDPTKIIKVVHAPIRKQMDRELNAYKRLADRPEISYAHIPKYYGQVETDKGTGYVFDLIRNSDGSIPQSLHWHLQNGISLAALYLQLKALKSYLLTHSIIFCNDMSYDGNIFIYEASDGTLKLSVIDGLGDVVLVEWLNNFDFFARRKINRRWARLMQRLMKFEAECNKQQVNTLASNTYSKPQWHRLLASK